ncbi:unnamed protein product [Adineta steineri]|uniref:Uncharacterized protein n=1 Tax=Adineta steineri TaxID=433720 RepID=A0A815JKU2_9BILA|nr:unnamed protein product [Adineta steineri]CAF1383430.1 unnamed protein product [Adineta steineri]
MDQSNRISPQSVNSDISEIQPTQSTRSRGCIRSKLTWIIFTIVIIAGISIPTAIILTKKGNVVETNLTTIITTTGKGSTTLMLTTIKSSTTTTTAEPGSTTTQAVCQSDATAITFDDIPSANPREAELPINYAGLTWTNGYYINITTSPKSGYRHAVASGIYVGWSRDPMTMQTLSANSTMTFVSCIMAAGWSNSTKVKITGYYSNTQLNTTTYSLNTYTKTSVVLNWSGINKVIFTPSGSGDIDYGMDNLCIIF